MARTLKELQKRYNSDLMAPGARRGPGPGGRHGPGVMGGGKPQNARKTVGRLLKYIGNINSDSSVYSFLCC